MSILRKIMAERRNAVEELKRGNPVEKLKEQASQRPPKKSLAGRLLTAGTNVVAEIKKASPSAGLLRGDCDPGSVSAVYAANGAVGISVLTEPGYFGGCKQDLLDVKGAVDLPVLRKDFICDAWQVFETAAWGADVLLLIIAGLDSHLLVELYHQSIECGLDVLAEAHTEEEAETALGLEKCIVGVNSRNLDTLETDLETARKVSSMIPQDRVSIAESGIKCREDIVELQERGYNGFLVGELLMKADDPGSELRALRGS